LETTFRRALNRAIKNAGLPHLTIHDLRHVNASRRLVTWAEDLTYVSKQLGHADPSITLSTYAHLLDRARHAEEGREAMEAEFGNGMESSDGKERQSAPGLKAV
jgi:integrase